MDWGIWRDRAAWPFSAPGYTFFPEAALQLLAIEYPEEDWPSVLGHHDVAARGSISHPAFAIDEAGKLTSFGRSESDRVYRILAERGVRGTAPVTKVGWELAHRVWAFDQQFGDAIRRARRTGLDRLQSLLAHGVLVASIRDEATGEMDNIDPKFWNRDRAHTVGAFCQCKVRVASRAGDFWIFVQSEHLEAVAAALREDRIARRPVLKAAPEASEADCHKPRSGLRPPDWLPWFRTWYTNWLNKDSEMQMAGKPARVFPTDPELRKMILGKGFEKVGSPASIGHHRRKLDKEFGRQ